MPAIKISNIRKTEEVEIETENGTKKYVIREMTGEDHDKFLIWNSKRVSVDRNGKPKGLPDPKDQAAMLISYCLYTDNGEKVKIEEVRKFTTTAQNALVKICMDMHDMTNEKKAKQEEEQTEEQTEE